MQLTIYQLHGTARSGGGRRRATQYSRRLAQTRVRGCHQEQYQLQVVQTSIPTADGLLLTVAQVQAKWGSVPHSHQHQKNAYFG